MKALILNSGMGTRLTHLTVKRPKCMVDIGFGETIISRQLRMLQQCGITEIVMTTGPFNDKLQVYCEALDLDLHVTFVLNPLYKTTNYIYSVYLAREYLDDDILLCHGDLVFEESVLEDLVKSKESGITVSFSEPLSQKDFKAVLDNNRVIKVGIKFFYHAVTAQPLYKLNWMDWRIWLERIKYFCELGKVTCYAEDALNEISDQIILRPIDFGNRLCQEIDTIEDLDFVIRRLSGSGSKALTEGV